MEIVPGSAQGVTGRRAYRLAIAAAIVVAIAAGAWITRSHWRGLLQDASSGGEAESAAHSEEAEHAHAHGAAQLGLSCWRFYC